MAGTQPKDKNGLTPMQEKFCQEVAKGETYSGAFRCAYNTENYKPESVNRKACELMSNVNIVARVDKLREENRERNAVTVESITKELDAQVALASGEKQHSAALSGINTKAKLHGLLVEKKDITTKGRSIGAFGMAHDELTDK